MTRPVGSVRIRIMYAITSFGGLASPWTSSRTARAPDPRSDVTRGAGEPSTSCGAITRWWPLRLGFSSFPALTSGRLAGSLDRIVKAKFRIAELLQDFGSRVHAATMSLHLLTTQKGNAVVNATYTVNCSILLTDIPLLDRPQAAKDAGFEAVEFWWPFPTPSPSDAEVTAFTRAIGDAGVQLTGLNFAAGDMPAGDRGILSNPALTQDFRDSVAVAVGIAETLGTKAFNALYGNRDEDSDASTQDDIAAENLAHAAAAADRIGATVLLEPVSGAPKYPLKTAADVIRVIDRVTAEYGTTNLRLLADLYHLDVNGDDASAAIREHGSRIGHVQIADAPGRGEPGTGELVLAKQLQEILDGGYTGYFGLEYKPTRPDTFDWLPRAERGANGVNIETLQQQQETRI